MPRTHLVASFLAAIVMLVFINAIGASQLFIEPEILNNYQAGVITNT